jgi:outer membrane protein insertion porin family/translocation and assembly module TamA
VTADPFNRVTWRLRADFQQPWFLDTENVLNLGIFTERQSLPPIYARLSYGGDVRFSREIGPNTGLALGYRASRDSLEEGSADLLFCANFGVCRPRDIDRLSETRWLSPISVNLVHNRADAVLNPSRGYRLSLEGEHASRLTGSQWAYYRMQAEASWYQRLGDNVLALRVRTGLVEPIGSGLEDVDFLEGVQDDVTHPLKRQYAGGANTVRGYGQNLLGPKILLADSLDLAAISGCDAADITDENFWPCDPGGLGAGDVSPRPVGGQRGLVGNIELRFPFSSRWSGVAFLDVGKVWTPGGEIRVAEDLAWSPGVGFRYRSPVGPLRLDVGYNTSAPERLPVVSVVQRGGEDVIVQLGSGPESPNLFEYDPYGGRSLFEKFVNRLQLHISIGQAF